MQQTRNIRVPVDAETVRNAQALEKLTGTPFKSIIGSMGGSAVKEAINKIRLDLDLHIPAPGEAEVSED